MLLHDYWRDNFCLFIKITWNFIFCLENLCTNIKFMDVHAKFYLKLFDFSKFICYTFFYKRLIYTWSQITSSSKHRNVIWPPWCCPDGRKRAAMAHGDRDLKELEINGGSVSSGASIRKLIDQILRHLVILYCSCRSEANIIQLLRKKGTRWNGQCIVPGHVNIIARRLKMQPVHNPWGHHH
jgi:hypothetical protein